MHEGMGATALHDESFPQLRVLTKVVVVLLAAMSIPGAEPGHQVQVAVVLVVAVAPWCLTWRRGRWSYWWSALTLAALGFLQIAGPAAGWLGPEAAGQTSLCLVLWLALDDAVSRPPMASRTTATVSAGIIAARAFNDPIDATLIWLAGLLLCHLGGAVLRTVAMTVVRLREAEGQLARDAVHGERRRVAREVHDVVAHSLSVTALHISAARMANTRRDEDATREALVDAEELTRASLADLRRTISLLRSPDDDGVDIEAALPGLGELEPVVESFRAAGMDCCLSWPSPPPVVDDLTGLALLRVTQEGLTNATRHQVDPSAEVSLTVVAGSLRLRVLTRGRCGVAGRPGTGLVGMAERVEALGGTLRAGAAPDGWSVEAELPHPSAPTGPIVGSSGRDAPVESTP